MLIRARGFSLIELVIGMVVLAIALTLFTSVLTGQARHQSSLWHQMRATELAQTLLNEIVSRAFDENSPQGNTLQRCDQTGVAACINQIPSCPSTGVSASTEESNRAQYDDVDDYHCLVATGAAIQSSAGAGLAALYEGYTVRIQVDYAGTELGLSSNRLAKRIDVTVENIDGSSLLLSAYRGNW